MLPFSNMAAIQSRENQALTGTFSKQILEIVKSHQFKIAYSDFL